MNDNIERNKIEIIKKVFCITCLIIFLSHICSSYNYFTANRDRFITDLYLYIYIIPDIFVIFFLAGFLLRNNLHKLGNLFKNRTGLMRIFLSLLCIICLLVFLGRTYCTCFLGGLPVVSFFQNYNLDYFSIILDPLIVVFLSVLLLKNILCKLGRVLKSLLKRVQQFLSKPYAWNGIIGTVILLAVSFGIYKGIEVNSLPKCDSDFAINEVEEIYKQNSGIYQYQSSVGQVLSLEVDSPRIDRYDKDSNKYYCLATVKLQVTGRYSNGYTDYNTKVYYDITKSRGKPIVFARFRGKGSLGLY